MNLETIKKLCESIDREDVKIGMELLMVYIETHGLKNFNNIRVGGMAAKATAAIHDIKPYHSPPIVCKRSEKEDFVINTVADHIRDKSYVVYGEEGRFEVLKNYFDE